jgi:hypothetical protein
VILKKELTMTAAPPKPPKETPIDIEVKEALRQVLALRALTSSTGTLTTYTQNKVLRALSAEGLTRVAVILNELDKGSAQ